MDAERAARLDAAMNGGHDLAAGATWAPVPDDERVAPLDDAAVFGRAWLMVAHRSELGASGWVRRVIGRRQVVVVRGEDGEIRAFHNVCPHRGAELVDGERGECASFTCRYHRFQYARDGRLVFAPQRASFGGLLDDLRLLPVRCSIWRGLVFVCFDVAAPPLVDALGVEISAIADGYRLDELVVHGVTEIEVAHSWRLGVEGGLENLHLPTVHPRTAGPTLDIRRSATFRDGPHSYVVAPYRLDDLYEPTGPFGRAIAAAGVPLLPPPGSLERRANFTALVFPNLSISFVPHHLWLLLFWPTGPRSCRMVHYTLGLPTDHPPAAAMYAAVHAAVDQVAREDSPVVTSVQRGVAGGALQRSPLSGHEVRVAWFREALDAWHRRDA
jgi:phenylpropionate dioxygenase-like ring-hydroxylating dioxygenase large terminal subunit